jgi:hypothetical protein
MVRQIATQYRIVIVWTSNKQRNYGRWLYEENVREYWLVKKTYENKDPAASLATCCITDILFLLRT